MYMYMVIGNLCFLRRSVLFSCAGRSSLPTLKAAAIDSLRCFLSGLPLRRWFLLSSTHTNVVQYSQQPLHQYPSSSESPSAYIHQANDTVAASAMKQMASSHRASAGSNHFSDKVFTTSHVYVCMYALYALYLSVRIECIHTHTFRHTSLL